jgi:hypothetical protein
MISIELSGAFLSAVQNERSILNYLSAAPPRRQLSAISNTQSISRPKVPSMVIVPAPFETSQRCMTLPTKTPTSRMGDEPREHRFADFTVDRLTSLDKGMVGGDSMCKRLGGESTSNGHGSRAPDIGSNVFASVAELATSVHLTATEQWHVSSLMLLRAIGALSTAPVSTSVKCLALSQSPFFRPCT